MSDIQSQISEATTKILALRSEWEGLEKDARALEGSAREKRVRMDACKTEIASLDKVLGHARVISATEEAAAAAVKSKEAAEKARTEQDAEIAARIKKLDELIAKAEKA